MYHASAKPHQHNGLPGSSVSCCTSKRLQMPPKLPRRQKNLETFLDTVLMCRSGLNYCANIKWHMMLSIQGFIILCSLFQKCVTNSWKYMKLLCCFKVCMHMNAVWSFIDFKIKPGQFLIIFTLKSEDYKLLECQQSA